MKVRHMGMIFTVLKTVPSIVNGSKLHLIQNEKFIKYAPTGKCRRVSEGTNRQGPRQGIEPRE
jgi:hypothetical protein